MENIKIIKLGCFRCGHRWTPRKEHRPVQCPRCKCLTWDIDGYAKCEVCERNFLNIYTHHIDGNHKNNKEDNRMRVCSSCHQSIHQGMPKKTSRKDRTYGYWRQSKADYKIMNKLKEVRKLIILKNKKIK